MSHVVPTTDDRLLPIRCTHFLAALLLFALVVSVLLPLSLDFFGNHTRALAPDGSRISVGVDFDFRHNEICCLREGVDPFLVRNGIVPSDTYAYYLAPPTNPPRRRLDAYPPWSYTFFFWITFLPERASWCLYYTLMALALCALPAFGAGLAAAHGAPPRLQFLVALASLFVSFPVTACLHTGNYGIFIAAALCAFLWSMRNGHRILAALMWAFMMVKPQAAALLAVPLLIHREWKVCAMAAAFCLAAAVPPALLSHQSVLTLILEIPKFGASVATQTKLVPASLMSLLSPALSPTVLNLFSAAVGLVICAFLSWRIRHLPSWPLRILPAVVLGSYWTYSLPHNDCSLGVAQAVFCLFLLNSPRQLKCPAALCFFSTPLLHVQRLFSIENTPWTLWRLLGLSFPDTSLLVRALSVLHLLVGYFFLLAFCLFCLRLSHATLPTWTDSSRRL